MTERAIVEYVVNQAWQIPLLALGAWALVKMVRPAVRVEHWVWLAVLALAVALPMRGIELAQPVAPKPMAAVVSVELERAEIALLQQRAANLSPYLSQTSQATGWRGLRKPGMHLSVAVTRWVVGLYAATIVLGFIRFACAWGSARRLVRRAQELSAREVSEALDRCGLHSGSVVPRLLESSDTAGPVIVGGMKPVLLLPLGFWQHTDDEIRAALLHELAHVRRRDYLVNLLCQLAALPVAWHPATRVIQRRIRLTREMACDAIAAEQMRSSAGYAHCLMSLAKEMLARQTLVETQALGLFERRTMEERVMRLTELAATGSASVRAKALRVVAGMAAMLAVVVATLMFHVTPTSAASAAESVTAGLAQSQQQSAGSDIPAATPAASMDEALPVAQTATPAAPKASEPTITPAPITSAAPSSAGPGSTVSSSAADEDWPVAVAGKGGHVHRWVGADGKKYVTANRDPKEPNAEERLRMEQSLKDSQKELDEMKRNIADWKDVQKDLVSPELKAQVDEAARLARDPKMKQQVREIEKQAAEIAKNAQLNLLNSPEWQKQMAEMQKTFNDPAWQKQMAELEKNAQLNLLNNPEWKKQTDEMQKIMAEMVAKTHDELARGGIEAKLDAAQKMLDEARDQIEELRKK